MLNRVPKFMLNMSTIFACSLIKRPQTQRNATKKQHMRNAVQPNPDLRQVTILENTLRKEDSIGVYSYSIYFQRIRDAADNCDAFSKATGGKIAACTKLTTQ